MVGWRKAVGMLALTLIVLVGLVPGAHAAQTFVTGLSNDGVTAGSGPGSYVRWSRAFYSRGVDMSTGTATQDSSVVVVHNRQSFAVGRLDLYSNTLDTVLAVKVTEKNDAIANVDLVQLWRDNGDGIFDPNTDVQVSSSVAGLAFTGVAASDSIATFAFTPASAVAAGMVVPAQAAWTNAGNMNVTGAHLTLFVVYKTAQQVYNGTKLRAAFQAGTSGVVLSSTFQDPANVLTGVFNNGAGASLNTLLEDDAIPAGYELAAAYTVPALNIGGIVQTDYNSPTLGFYSLPAAHHGTAGDVNVPIVKFDLTAPGPIGGTLFGRADVGAVRDTLNSVIVSSENTYDLDVKTVRLWLKARGNTADSVQISGPANLPFYSGNPDTLIAEKGNVAGATPFSNGKVTLNANKIVSFLPTGKDTFLLTYELNAQGSSHDNDVLDLKIAQFDIFGSRTGYTPPNDAAVDNAVITFQSLPFTVWIDTLNTQRALNANSVPDHKSSGDRLKLAGTINIGDSTNTAGCFASPELAQVKVKNANSDIDSLIVDLRAFGHGMRYSLGKSGWRPLGSDSVWSDTFAVIDPSHGTFNDANGYWDQFSLDRYAADSYNRPDGPINNNGGTGFLVSPDGPYTLGSGPAAGVAALGKGFPKWFAYRHDLSNNVVVDSGWATTGFPGDKYSNASFTPLPVNTWLPDRVKNVYFSNADSGKVNIHFESTSGGKLENGNNTAGMVGGTASFLIYAQANWKSGDPSGDIDWSHAVDTIPDAEYWNGSNFFTVDHRIRDLFGVAGNPATKVMHLADGKDYLFGVRTRDAEGNLELNKFAYSDVPDTLGPVVNLIAPTRSCGIYGPEHALDVFAVVDSASKDVNSGSVYMHFRVKDIDPSTAGDQPGAWDSVNVETLAGGDFDHEPVQMSRIGSSFWYNTRIVKITSSHQTDFWQQDIYEYTVTSTDNSGNTETADHAYNRVNSLLQGGLNHNCVIWDHVSPVCELIKINGQETSSAQLPQIDAATDSTTLTVRVTDAVEDYFGLPYFVRSNLGGDSHTYGWVYPVNHELTVKYPTVGAVGSSPVPGGLTGLAYVEVMDSAYNFCESEAAFFIRDNTPPSAYWSAPQKNFRLAFPCWLTVKATDNACLAGAVFTLYDNAGTFLDTIITLPAPTDEAKAARKNAKKLGAKDASVSETYSYYWQKSLEYAIARGLTDGGVYVLKATVYDCAGNTVTATTSFIFDGLAPTLKLAIIDPVMQNGHVVVSNGSPVAFKATPSGPYSNDVVKAEFFSKSKSAPDEYFSYNKFATVTAQRDGGYWATSVFPDNDSIVVRVIGFDAAGNMAYDTDDDGEFDPGTLAAAFTTPSAVLFYTIAAPDWALESVTDVTTGQVYHVSPKLNKSQACAYATGDDSLWIQPQDDSQAQNTAFVEYRLSGPGIGSNLPNNTNATIQLGHSNSAPYNFGFSLKSLGGLQEYLAVNGYWTGTLTMRVYDISGSYTDEDAICLGVTNTRPSQACITEPLPGCVVYGDVSVSAIVIDSHFIRKVRFEYQDRSSGEAGAWVPFDSALSVPCSDNRASKIKPQSVPLQCPPQTFSATWHTKLFNLADGQYGLRAVAIDSAGNIDASPKNIVVTLDNKGPSVSLGPVPAWVGGGTSWVNPLNGHAIYPVLHLSAVVTGGTPQASVTFQAKAAGNDPGGTWVTLGTVDHAPYVMDYVFTASNQNLWKNNLCTTCGTQIRAVVDDEACGPGRNAFDLSAIIKCDFSAPVCYFTSVADVPVNGNTLPVDVTSGTSVPLVAGAWDNVPTADVNVGMDSVSFTVNSPNGTRVFDVGYPASAATAGQYTVYWNTTGLTAGLYTVNFKAWDLLHNYCSSSTQVKVIDNLAPIASICAITDHHVLAISYDRDVNDITFQYRPQGGTNWRALGIATRLQKSQLTKDQAKALGRRVARKLANGNVPVTLWSTDYDASKDPNGTYEFRAIARDTANNSDPSQAPLTSGTLAVNNGLATWTFAAVPQLKSLSFTGNESACDSVIVNTTTDGSCGIPGVVVVSRAINQPATSFYASLVSMGQNSINSTTFYGSAAIDEIVGNGGNAWVFACCMTSANTVSLIQNGLVDFAVTPSLGSNSTVTGVDGYASAYFPPNSLSYTTSFEILPVDMPQPQPDNNRVRGVPTPSGALECFTQCYYNFKVKGGANKQSVKENSPNFNKPVTIGLKYGTPAGPNTQKALTVARWDYNNSQWVFGDVVRATINPANNTASALVNRDGCYAVVELDTACSAGNLTLTDVRAIPGELSAPAHQQVPLNSGYVDAKPCFSANIQETFSNSDNVSNVEVWVRPVGGNYIKMYDYKNSFTHCGLDQNSGYEAGSGFLNLCYEAAENEGCADNNPGSDDGAFPALKTGNYQLKVTATTRLGYCQTQEVTFNVDANGPTVANLTPAYQGNNPVIVYSASDAGAGVSQKWQAVDLFVQEFDRDNATIKSPIYKGTFYPGTGIASDSSRANAGGGTTFFYSVKTNFDLKKGDHLRAVVYGGQDADWFIDAHSSYDGTGPARQYVANGGVRDSLNNAAGPLEINTTYDPDHAVRPGVTVITAGCVGPNASIKFTVADDGAGIDWSSLSITYSNAATGAVYGTHHINNVTRDGNTVTDATTFNWANGTSVKAVIHVTDNGSPRGEENFEYNFTVDATGPTITLASGANQTDAKIALDVDGKDCAGNFDIDWSTVTVTINGVATEAFTVDQGLHRIYVNNPGFGKTLVVTVMDKAGNTGTYRGTTESGNLGFGSGGLAPHNYPNPFDNKASNNTTTIALGLTKSAIVEIRIFDLAGNPLKSWSGINATPVTTVIWDGRDDEGRAVARGVYLARIKATDGSRTASAIIKIAVAR